MDDRLTDYELESLSKMYSRELCFSPLDLAIHRAINELIELREAQKREKDCVLEQISEV